MCNYVKAYRSTYGKYLGHPTITTTEGIYDHFDDTKHKKTVASLSDFLNKDKEMD